MRMTRVVVATTMLMGSAAPVWACDLDGPGGHRFFAFANMYRGGQADQPTQEREQRAPARDAREESERDRQGGNGGSEPGETSRSEPDRQDPATFR